MSDTSVTYEGDGIEDTFAVTFPYLAEAYVKVQINGINVLNPAVWYFSGSSLIFRNAPADGASVKIYRETAGSTRLVNFTNAAVLTEADLNLSADQNFHLVQESKENFADLINAEILRIGGGAGIVSTDPDEIIAGLVEQVLEDATALNLSQRVTDIDDNAEAIVSLAGNLQVQINAVAQGVAATIYLDDDEPVPGAGSYPDPIPEGARWYDTNDNNEPYIYTLSAWLSIEDPRIGAAATDITALQVETGDNAAAVVAEALVRTNADSAMASTIALVGAENGGATAFILDTNTVKIDSDVGDTLATRLTFLTAEDDANSASITTINSVTIPGVQADADAAQDDADTLMAKVGVTLNVNDYITGWSLNNNGSTGEFIILADKFAIVDAAGGPGLTEYVPFEISGGKINMTGDVKITGSLVVDGTITSDELTGAQLSDLYVDMGSITAGNIVLDSSGFIRGGSTAYNTGAGFWLGYDTSTYKFSIGDGAANSLTWDGTTLQVIGDILVGEYVASDTPILTAATERSENGAGASVLKKEFTIDRSGTIRVKCWLKSSYAGGDTINHPYAYIKKNEVIQSTETSTSVGWVEKTQDVTVVAGDEIQIYLDGGDGETVGVPFDITGYIKDATIEADVGLTTGGSVDTD